MFPSPQPPAPSPRRFAYVRAVALAVVYLLAGVSVARASDGAASFIDVAREVQPKVVKLYGAGGPRGLVAYQSGLLISGKGHVLTASSYVLDADEVTVVLNDGRHFTAKYVASDPITEIAMLQFDPGKEEVPHFDLAAAKKAEAGTRVLAFSNLFGIAVGDEPVSMLHGVISAVAPLEARRGAFTANYHGDVYVVDASSNNPGAAGGALTDADGHLLGMLGKELRSNVSGTWLNYALPVSAFAATAEDMMAGRFTPPDTKEADRPTNPLTLSALGVVLVPDVVTRTPPYVDRVLPNSPAAAAGLRPDDLVVMIDSQPAPSCREANRLTERLERDATLHLGVLREERLLEFTLTAKPTEPAKDNDPTKKSSDETKQTD
ncbi:MAG TPA: S1C family serine protease [Lacipirellulaceae bacterium]|nr:S1C family serine protease [Lacipirellulaceae bacterium]